MKPPPRKRTKRDYSLHTDPPPTPGRVGCTWPRLEQKKLSTALRKLSGSRPRTAEGSVLLPDLNPEHVRSHVSTRSTEEIQSVLETLKEKVILFAKNKHYTERREERKGQKPIEKWLRVASVVAGDVEEPLSSAFNQMFVVTSTEPCTLRNSDPPLDHSPATLLSKGTLPASSALAPPSISRAPPPQSPAVAGGIKKTLSIPQRLPHSTPNCSTATGAPTRSAAKSQLLSPSTVTEVSFERIYHYLSVVDKPSEHCRLTPMESAIVLDLLMALPEELLLLDCSKLVKHLTQMYQDLLACADSRMAKDFFKELNGQPQTVVLDQQLPHSAQEDLSSQSVTDVRLHSPLNPFLIPVSLLSRKANDT